MLREYYFLSMVFVITINLGFGVNAQDKNSCSSKTSQESGIWKTITYYISKIPEAWSLMNMQDLHMVQVGRKASSEKFHSQLKYIPLEEMMMFHPITTEAAREKTKKRSEKVMNYFSRIQEEGGISHFLLEEILPSNDPIQLIAIPDDMRKRESLEGKNLKKYIVIQGQGRIQSLKMVLSPPTRMEVEVSELSDETLNEVLSVRKAYQEQGFSLD